MRITVRLDGALLTDAKSFAARTGRTLSQLIEAALRSEAALRGPRPTTSAQLPVAHGGRLRPGVHLDPMSGLLDAMEGDLSP